MQPLVPGFTITGKQSVGVTGSIWTAVRNLDDHRFLLKVVELTEATAARVRAARLTAGLHRLENEHVVRLHTAIDLADGTLALVLDQVTGSSLVQVLRARGQLIPGETVTTVAPLFAALAELHAAGVAHGDLTPANLLFSAEGRPWISDPGLVRLLGRRAGAVDGPADFVAPEAVAGGEPTPAGDVCAMAALGWYCLTGQPPAPVAGRPSLTELRPEVPPQLVAVLTSCLSPNPAVRPSAALAATQVFDSVPAEPVALASVSDPAAEVTRRIRAAACSAAACSFAAFSAPAFSAPALSAPAISSPSTRGTFRRPPVIGIVALLVAAALGAVPPRSCGARRHRSRRWPCDR